MKWAFWKRNRPTRKAPASAASGPEPEFDSTDPESEEAAARALRVRTRRRLIGACALLLTAVILVPMVLDPAPRAVPDTIPIDLPSDKTPFAPHLSAPAADAAAQSAPGAAAIPAAPGAAADTAADAAAAPAHAADPPASAPDSTAHAKKHTAADAPKADTAHAGAGKIFVQAAALSHESAARKLASRIAKAGLTPFVERTGTGESVRFRVRLGPYATRTEAEQSRDRLHAIGVEANIVGA